MKQLYVIGGTMGVGKSTTCRVLQQKLEHSVFLDGDWCWQANPFLVTEETKRMVVDNICYLLNRFLHCSAYRHIIFCWVLHQQSVIDEILARLDLDNCRVSAFSLTCTQEMLRRRLQGDIARGLRREDVVERSLARLPLYAGLSSTLIDTTHRTPEEAAAAILRRFQTGSGGGGSLR